MPFMMVSRVGGWIGVLDRVQMLQGEGGFGGCGVFFPINLNGTLFGAYRGDTLPDFSRNWQKTEIFRRANFE